MISMYTGTPGSGKSLHVAKDIYYKLRCKKWVFANFSINYNVFIEKKGKKNTLNGTFIERDNLHLKAKWFMNFALEFFARNKRGQIIESQALIVIDECQVMFNSRDYQAKDRMEWIIFFTQHRKYGFDIILVTQADRLVDRQIRSLVEYEIRHRKLNNYKFYGKLLGFLAGGSMFIAVKFWYPIKEKIDSDMFKGKKKYYEFYDSYKLFG